jgi:hypothetical protein
MSPIASTWPASRRAGAVLRLPLVVAVGGGIAGHLPAAAFVLPRRNKDLRSRPAPAPARAVLLQTLGTLALVFNVVS